MSKIIRDVVKKATGKKTRAVKRPPPKPIKDGKVTELEGARANPKTGGSDKVAKDIESGKAGKVTSTAEPGFLQEQKTATSRAIAKLKVDLQEKVDKGTATKAEKQALRELRVKDQLDTSRAQQAAGQTAKANRKARADAAKRTDYVDPESGEIVGKPTKRQIEAAMRNARARNMTSREREYRAFLEKEYGANFNKGGMSIKKAIGPNDYRKGGMVLSTIDNRRNK